MLAAFKADFGSEAVCTRGRWGGEEVIVLVLKQLFLLFYKDNICLDLSKCSSLALLTILSCISSKMFSFLLTKIT